MTRRHRGGVSCLQPATEPVDTVGGLDVDVGRHRRLADERTTSVAERCQVFGGKPTTLDVVDAHARETWSGNPTSTVGNSRLSSRSATVSSNCSDITITPSRRSDNGSDAR